MDGIWICVRAMATRRGQGLLIAASLALAALPALAFETLRVASWNIQTVGAPGTTEHTAALAVLGRLDAAVVALQEVASDADVGNLASLAASLGYPYAIPAAAGPYGALRGAVLSRHPLQIRQWASPDLALDTAANDLTRYLLQADVVVPGSAEILRIVTTHWKSGSANADEFRRAIESFRMSQIAGATPAGTPFMLMGDVNADIGDGALSPSGFTAYPTGLPADFVAGADIRALMQTATGLINNPFFFLGTHASMIDALQADGTDATRPFSGRRIDYLYANALLHDRGIASQIYDCADEGLVTSLPLAGTPLPADTCAAASDHLPLFADIQLASAGFPAFTLTPGSLPFGDATLNVSAPPLAVTVNSNGTAPLSLQSVTLSGTHANQFSYQNSCLGDIAPDAQCTITVSFRPTTTGGKSATLTIDGGAIAGVRSVALSGTGVTSAFSLSPTKLSFGRIARGSASPAQTVSLTNTGRGLLPITGISLAGTNPGQFSFSSGCASQIAVGASCSISVSFKPTSTGSKSASLRVTVGGGASARSVSLSGTGY